MGRPRRISGGPGRGQHPSPLLTVRVRSAPGRGDQGGAGHGRRPAEVRRQLPRQQLQVPGGARISRLLVPLRAARGPSPGSCSRCCLPNPPARLCALPFSPAVYPGELGPLLSRALPPPRVHAHLPRNELPLGSRQRTRSLKFWSWAISGKKKPLKSLIYPLRFKAFIRLSSFVLITASLDS